MLQQQQTVLHCRLTEPAQSEPPSSLSPGLVEVQYIPLLNSSSSVWGRLSAENFSLREFRSITFCRSPPGMACLLFYFRWRKAGCQTGRAGCQEPKLSLVVFFCFDRTGLIYSSPKSTSSRITVSWQTRLASSSYTRGIKGERWRIYYQKN